MTMALSLDHYDIRMLKAEWVAFAELLFGFKVNGHFVIITFATLQQ